MAEQVQVNPYAAGSTLDNALVSAPSQLPLRLDTARIIFTTYGSVIVSGALFGVLAAGLIALSVWDSTPEMAILPAMGLVAGAVIAAIFGLPTVLLVFCLSAPLVRPSRGWLVHQARWYAAICGACSGFFSMATFGSFEFGWMLFSTIPATFGCVGTSILVHWTCRPRKPVASP